MVFKNILSYFQMRNDSCRTDWCDSALTRRINLTDKLFFLNTIGTLLRDYIKPSYTFFCIFPVNNLYEITFKVRISSS
jgi:hypothetical protein